MGWKEHRVETVEIDGQETLDERSAYVDVSSEGGKPLRFGEETLFVNASIMNVRYNPVNAPWMVDLDLPLANESKSEDHVLSHPSAIGSV